MLDLELTAANEVILGALAEGIQNALAPHGIILRPALARDAARTAAGRLADRMQPHVEFDEEGILDAIRQAGRFGEEKEK